MSFKLLGNWKEVLTKAWSSRLMALAFVLTALEVILTLLAVPSIPFTILTGLVTAGAFVARLVAQENLSEE